MSSINEHLILVSWLSYLYDDCLPLVFKSFPLRNKVRLVW
jgi:hypothetical protein